METHLDTGGLIVRSLVVGPLENNVWVVASPATGDAVIIDAADESDRILEAVQPYRVQAILTTHSHADHIGAAVAVGCALSIPFRIHPMDAPAAGIVPFDPIDHGEEMPVGDVMLRAVHTPGHTPGSTCFVTGGMVFSGDTLFPGGPGATADPLKFEEIMISLERHLFSLPDETLVLPGHGASTTIGKERPAVAEWWRRGY